MSGSRSPQIPVGQSSEAQSGVAVIVRLFWMFLGNIGLIVFSFRIAQTRGSSSANIVFWATAVAMVALRLIDIRFLRGQTTTCVRATMRDWWRYLAGVAGAAAVLWILGHTLFRQIIG